MPTTPTPETHGSLDERVQDHREALTLLIADTGRCDDISSGVDLNILDDIPILSDRRLKRDITAVDWSR